MEAADQFRAYMQALEALVLELVRQAEQDAPNKFDRLEVSAKDPADVENVAMAAEVNRHLARLLARSREANRRLD